MTALYFGATAWIAPLALSLAALATRASGLDIAIEDAFFDNASLSFTWRSNAVLEVLGHHGLRSLLTALWVALSTGTAISFRYRRWYRWRWHLAAVTLAMALGPIIVVVLKSFTTFPCPWNLPRYGGFAIESAHWFTTPALAGRCFPAGHAAGGFSLLAIAFGLAAAGQSRLARLALLAALFVGCTAAAVRMLQGAHFLSHSLWSAAIDWAVAVAVFHGLSLLGRLPGSPGPSAVDAVG